MILGASEMQGKSSHQGVGWGESGDEEIVYVCVCVQLGMFWMFSQLK